MSFDEIVSDLKDELFDNSKFSQDKLAWIEILTKTGQFRLQKPN